MKRESIKRAIIEGKFFERAYTKIKRVVVKCLNGEYRKKLFRGVDLLFAAYPRYRMMKNTEINNNKILLTTFSGKYNCNPKAIADEILRQKLPWDLVWVAKKGDLKMRDQFPLGIRLVLWESLEFYKEAASAKIWIANSTYLRSLRATKKQGQILIQTWHGSLGLKRFETNQNKRWIRTGKADGDRTDYCISNSQFENDLYQKTFWNNARILTIGHARNDILITKDIQRQREIALKVRERLNIPEGVQVALYAPTFRDSKSLEPYSLDYELLRGSLQQRFGGEWIILCRLHFQVQAAMKKKKLKLPEFVINATKYEDIQDILLITDVGITDYSSWICDFVLTKKPAFLFATDMEDYCHERGFYFPLESTPFPLATDNQQLIANILNFDAADYKEECEAFIADKGCIDDGHAAERIVEKLKEIMEENV